MKTSDKSDKQRADHNIICDIVDPGKRVLDLGCGNGDLMLILSDKKNSDVQGIEISEEAIYNCVEKGLYVFHGDIDGGLIEYPDKSFDYVILNQSMQQVKHVGYVIDEALRVGEKVIVGFPNFAFLTARFRLFFMGKTPITKALPYRWYDTPNLHFLTNSDFKDFCSAKKIDIENTYYIGKGKRRMFWPNLFAEDAIFVISRKK